MNYHELTAGTQRDDGDWCPREAAGTSAGMQREATGSHGKPREATGSHINTDSHNLN